MTALSYQISTLLEKMTSPDKDYRFMATNDLMTELQKDSITLDDDTERKVVKTLLHLLEDKNGEVQNLAVRCLGPLVHKIKVQQLETVVDNLCTNMESQNDQLRDVSSIALKTVMAEVPGGVSPVSNLCVKRVLPRLTAGLCQDIKTDVSVKLEILDIMSNIVLRFGRSLPMNLDEIEQAVFMQLEKERPALRKRSINALGHLVDVVPNDQYDRIVDKIFRGCQHNAGNVSNLRTYVSAASGICRSSSNRFAHFLPQFVPQFVTYCKEIDDDELREACLHAFETFSCHCTRDVVTFLSSIIDVCSEFVKYDPNYHYDETDDINLEPSGNEMETDEKVFDEEEDDDDQDEYSDDDDLSWKVRRAAAKCIESIINYHPDKLCDNYVKMGPLLLQRFKEREDNVKYDIFQAYSALLKQTIRMFPDHHKQNMLNSNSTVDCIAHDDFKRLIEEELTTDQRKIFDVLASQIQTFVRAVYAQIKGKNLRTRQHCFILLSNLLRAYPNTLDSYFRLFIGPIQLTLNDKSADGNLKITTLNFVAIVLNTHRPSVLHPFVGSLTPLVVNAIHDPFYKISSEALGVAQHLIHILRTDVGQTVDEFVYSPYVEQIYGALVIKLKISDIDQEVKEKTINAMGLLISAYGDEPSVKLDECLPLLVDRLRNEMTRCVTVRAINAIASSKLKMDLTKVLPDIISCFAKFLRKNQRTLRILTLISLESLVHRYARSGLENCGLVKVVNEIPSLINEQDLQITLLSLKFITDVISCYPDQIADNLPNLFSALLDLIHSSLLQGATLTAALNLLTAISKSPLPNKPKFEEILDKLFASACNCTNQLLNRQVYISIAKSIATVAHAYNDLNKTNTLIKKLHLLLTSKKDSDSVQLFAVLTLGELGRIYNDAFKNANIEPETLIVDAFNSHLEEIKTAASYALGSLAVGNLKKYLPFLLKEINENPKRQYLLLHALKEVITSESYEETNAQKKELVFSEELKLEINAIWKVLAQHCDCAEEGIRNIVAECLGKLCLVDPENFLPHLLECVKSDSHRVRATAVTAIRFMIVDHPVPVDELLRPAMGTFLQTIQDEDLQVRRVAIVTLNSAAHNKPKLIRDCLPQLLPQLYSETIVKPNLVYEVEMGPFKHVVDDGLDLRKAAFECMYTLAEQCLDRIDVFEYMNYLENGLKDLHDIKLLTFLMLIRLVSKCPMPITQRVDRFCDLIKPQLLLRPKQNAVKQENEKQDELKRAAVRTVLALKQIQERSQKLNELLEVIRGSTDLNTMLENLERDSISFHSSLDVTMDAD